VIGCGCENGCCGCVNYAHWNCWSWECGCETCFVMGSVTKNEILNGFCSVSGYEMQIDCVIEIHCY